MAHAAPPVSIDARTLDVSGIKAGMGLDEAKNAVAKHFGIAPSAVKVDPYPSVNPVTGTKLPKYLNYEGGNQRLAVHFEPRIPIDKSNPQVVSQIIYELPWTQENAKAVAEAAIRKYGPPSNGTNGVNLQWCEKPNPNLGMGCGTDNEAILSVAGTKVEFIDRARINARIAAMNKAQSAKPSF